MEEMLKAAKTRERHTVNSLLQAIKRLGYDWERKIVGRDETPKWFAKAGKRVKAKPAPALKKIKTKKSVSQAKASKPKAKKPAVTKKAPAAPTIEVVAPAAAAE